MRSQWSRNTRSVLVALWVGGSFAAASAATTNQIPNPEFRGSAGAVEEGGGGGIVNGPVPTLWRGFAVGGAEITVEREVLAAGALFPGSPATMVVTLRVDTFGGDQGFDTSPTRFTLDPDRTYQGSVYLRSANGDGSNQSVAIGLPVFDETGAFTGRAPGSAVADVTSEWMLYQGPAFSEQPGTSAELSFRLNADGGDDAIQIALPTLTGVALANQAPNPGFDGAGGVVQGSVSGTIPDQWRGFAVNGGDATFATQVLAADALYPGSPAGTAVQMTVNVFGGDQGFDNEAALFPLVGGRHYQGQIYLRSANPDNSDVTVGIGLNAFDATPAFVPPFGTAVAEVGPEWRLYSAQSVRVDADAAFGSLAIRVIDTGGDASVLMALPRILGPDEVFADDFE